MSFHFHKNIAIVLASIVAALAPYLWGAARYGGTLLEARREWQAAAPHTTALGELRQCLAGAWWLPGALRPAPPRDPLIECGLPTGDGWWDVLRLLAGAKWYLDCLHEQVRQAEEEHAEFVGTLLVCGGLLLLLATLVALAALASSPPSRREEDEAETEGEEGMAYEKALDKGVTGTKEDLVTEEETENEEEMENKEEMEMENDENKDEVDNANEENENEVHKETEEDIEEEDHRENKDNEMEGNGNDGQKENEENTAREEGNEEQEENEESIEKEENKKEHKENEESVEKDENEYKQHKENEESVEKEEENEYKQHKENENIEKEKVNGNEEHKEHEECIEKEESSQAADNTNTVEATDDTSSTSFLPPIPRPPPPWDCPPKHYDGSRRALHQELLDFHRWAGGSDAEYQRRLRPVEDLRRVVATMWPQVRVEATGSLANGLYLAESDVDATLLGHWPASPSPLLALRDALQRAGVARLGQLTVLEKTTVPLVKFVHKATGLPVDVTLGSEAAVRAAELVRELLRRFPALAPISLLVRHYLRGLGLAEVFTGGVSSYAVTLMVTSFLQLQVHPDAQQDLGWLLVRFFAFYGYEFEFASTGISVVGRGRYLRKEDVPIEMPRGHRRADLCIQDPLCPTNDLGRSSFRVWDVRRAFQHAYLMLEAALFQPGVFAAPCSLLGRLLARHTTPQ